MTQHAHFSSVRAALFRRALAVLGLALSFGAPAFAQPMMGPPGGMGGNQGPVQVGTVTLHKEAVPLTTLLPGRVAASATAEIRPQVGGIIESVAFTEGSLVEKGDLLFQLQSDTYEASLAVAKANLAKVQAALPSAESKVNRYENLVAGGGVSQTELEDARVALLQAQADVAAAQANLQTAEINLAQTRITAPISGIIGVASVSTGALVSAGQQDALATIRQLEPVYIQLVDTSRNLLRFRESVVGDAPVETLPKPKVTITLEDGSSYEHSGTVELADTVVSETTGTISIRASIPNPERMLLPGMFVRATVYVGNGEQAYLVPQRAVSRNSEGAATAMFVGADDKVETKVIATERTYNNSWVVVAGVADGDRLIVDGLQKISEGTEVSAIDVVINEDGVVLQDMTKLPAPPADFSEGGGPPSGSPQGAPPDGGPQAGTAEPTAGEGETP